MLSSKGHVAVVVLGDVGRSPRMQYHAVSLLDQGYSVSLVGYDGTALIPALEKTDLPLSVIRFSVPSPSFIKKMLPIYFAWRIASLCMYLLHALAVRVPSAQSMKRVDCFLIQNPPALPLLAVVYVYTLWQKFFHKHASVIIIDWHNLGFSMLSNPMFSFVARLYERTMAPVANGHFCVTKAMKAYLISSFHIQEENIRVLYDCPPRLFRPMSCKEQHEILQKLHQSLCKVAPRSWYQNLVVSRQSLLTEETENGEVLPRAGRPALITTSTSWTPDEDIGQLLEALVSLDAKITEQESSLRLMVAITGKGPMRSYYQEAISKMTLQHIAIQTLWLEPGDYPKLLACADLGISLHTSTSGLDLPMKVLDLFGCEVPVLARDFQCLTELVVDDENGQSFITSEELGDNLWYFLKPLGQRSKERLHPHSFGELDRYSKALQDRRRWDENWNKVALPCIKSNVG